MKNLIDRIIKLREEIKDLDRSKKVIQTEINKKKLTLEELEKLTVNQLDMFEE